ASELGAGSTAGAILSVSWPRFHRLSRDAAVQGEPPDNRRDPVLQPAQHPVEGKDQDADDQEPHNGHEVEQADDVKRPDDAPKEIRKDADEEEAQPDQCPDRVFVGSELVAAQRRVGDEEHEERNGDGDQLDAGHRLTARRSMSPKILTPSPIVVPLYRSW